MIDKNSPTTDLSACSPRLPASSTRFVKPCKSARKSKPFATVGSRTVPASMFTTPPAVAAKFTMRLAEPSDVSASTRDSSVLTSSSDRNCGYVPRRTSMWHQEFPFCSERVGSNRGDWLATSIGTTRFPLEISSRPRRLAGRLAASPKDISESSPSRPVLRTTAWPCAAAIHVPW